MAPPAESELAAAWVVEAAAGEGAATAEDVAHHDRDVVQGEAQTFQNWMGQMQKGEEWARGGKCGKERSGHGGTRALGGEWVKEGRDALVGTRQCR